MVPVNCFGADALFLGGEDVQREDRQHGAVHRHRHAHLVERDAVEQLAHVEDRVDRHAGHPDVAGHPWVVAVVAAVRGEVERDRQALLAGGQVAAVERVGVLGGGEPGVLADRPRLVDVHRRVRAAHVRRQTGVRIEEVQALEVGLVVHDRYVDAFGRLPGKLLGGVPCLSGHGGGPLVARARRLQVAQFEVGEIRDAHDATSLVSFCTLSFCRLSTCMASSVRVSRSSTSLPTPTSSSTPARPSLRPAT